MLILLTALSKLSKNQKSYGLAVQTRGVRPTRLPGLTLDSSSFTGTLPTLCSALVRYHCLFHCRQRSFCHSYWFQPESLSDLNCLSVMQYAIEYLKVRHVIVCGHYGCGGVAAAYDEKDLGMIEHWLGAIMDVLHLNRAEIEALPNREARIDRLCELNVKAQVSRVARTPIVQEAWQRGQKLSIHGWIYGLKDGLIKDLDANITGPNQVEKAYHLEYGSDP